MTNKKQPRICSGCGLSPKVIYSVEFEGEDESSYYCDECLMNLKACEDSTIISYKLIRPQGRPRGRNFEILKRVRINEEQDKNWNKNTSKLIRDLLEGKLVPIELLKQLYNIMDSKMIPKEKMTAEEMEYITEIEEVLKIE